MLGGADNPNGELLSYIIGADNKLTDLQQKDNLAAANPQVVKEMQGVVREFIDSSQPPLSEVNQEKFNNIKKALSEAK
ncbi:hypothetical protein DTM11_26340 [Escherichia coli]|nr:hypothetical protein DTM11_26340 [Escherichia coli]